MKNLLFVFCILILPSVLIAGESVNTGKVLSVGKIDGVNTGICHIKVEGANFNESCSTAVYQTVYYECENNEEFTSIALAAFMSDKEIKITSDGCSNWGSSVANLKSLRIEK